MKWNHKCGIRALVLASTILIGNSSRGQSNNWSVVERGPDSKTLQMTNVVNGTNFVHKITVLATGLNYTNSSGQLVESKEEITILPGGGTSATEGRHKVYFPGDIGNGVLQVTTPDGRNLFSRPLCVCYDDGSNTVVIATLTNSIGWLTASNQVTYRDCFCGIHADIVASYHVGGFECDLVFRSRPDAPSAYGLSDADSTIELVTEFFNTADPQQIPSASDDWFGLQDDTLKFGKLTMTRGKAFAFNAANPKTPDASTQTPVYKSWIHTADGRKFLVEQVPLVYVAGDLDALPLSASIQNPASGIPQLAGAPVSDPARFKLPLATGAPASGTARFQKPASGTSRFASAHPAFPPSHGILTDTNRLLLASADFKQTSGVVLDYNEIDQSDLTDFDFQSGTYGTYYIAGYVGISGTATFGSGAILKFSSAGSAVIYLENSSSVVCDNSAEKPTVFTSANDDSLGEIIPGSSGNPSENDSLMFFNIDCPIVVLSNICFFYGNYSIQVNSGNIDLWNCQFLPVDVAVSAFDDYVDTGYHGGNIGLHNVLLQEVCDDLPVQGNTIAENVTLDGYWFLGGSAETNCLIVTDPAENEYIPFVPSGGVYVKTSDWGTAVYSTAPIFETGANANFYLAANSPYRNVGTTGINPTLLAELQAMTTYAPQDGGAADTAGTDLGYHYSVNEDSDFDGLPDSWEYYWFGNYSHSGNDWDNANQQTLLDDYNSQSDPNIIQFSIEAANDYVNTTSVTVQLNITAGIPSYYAVFVNSASTTNWVPFAGTNLVITVGPADGTYDIVVGLKGIAPNATETWRDYEFNLDRVAPTVTITSPVLATGTATVGKPYLQLQGYTDKQLVSLSYDINNSAGVGNGLAAYVIDQFFDTNQFEFTTNFFQAFDVPLTIGANEIKLHATDRAGNTATTSINVTLDYTTVTVAPVVQLIWPQDGMALSGTSCTIRGTMDDETGTIVARVVNGDSTTTIVNGLLERNNMFWIENVPLNGTSQITIYATNAAGISTNFTFTVLPASINLTIDSTPTGGGLYQASGTVSGQISDPNATVSVNGVPGMNHGNGTWSASNVPNLGMGTLTYDAVASDSGSGTGGGSGSSAQNSANASAAVETDPYVTIVDYHYQESMNSARLIQDTGDLPSTGSHVWGRTWDKHYNSAAQTNDVVPTYDGTVIDNFHYNDGGSIDIGQETYHWSADDPGSYAGETTYGGTIWPDNGELWWLGSDEVYYTESVPQNGFYYAKQKYVWSGSSSGDVSFDGYNDHYEQSYLHIDQISVQTQVKLWTGGKATINRKNLFGIQCSAAELFQPPGYFPDLPWAAGGDPEPDQQKPIWNDQPSSTIDPTTLIIAGKSPGADGNLWTALPDNSIVDFTVHAPGKKHFSAAASPQKYPVHIDANGHNLDSEKPEFCVGQLVTFKLEGLPSFVDAVGHWNLPGKYVNEQWQKQQWVYPGAWQSYGSINYRVNPDLLQITGSQNPPYTSCWFVNKVDPSGMVGANANLHFSNGQYASVAADGKISVFRPSVSMVNPHQHGTPTVIWETPWYSSLGITESGAIQLGVPSGTNDMGYVCRVVSPDFGGEAKIIQICNIDASGLDSGCTGCLDGGDPYTLDADVDVVANPNPAGGANTLIFDDSPDANTTTGTIYMNDSFVDYVMFSPKGAGDIFVPLGNLTWDVSASVTYPNTTISQFTDGPTGPNNSDTFPQWTTIKVDHH